MTRLNQIIAVEKDARVRAQRTRDEALADIAKAGLLSGLSRTYQPRAEDGDHLPAESTLVQLTVEGITERLSKDLTRLWDITATKDWANTEARADVVIDGAVLLAAVPSPHLVWLEKQLVELRTYLGRLPVLDPAERWHYDDNVAAWRSEPVTTTRTRKVPRTHVLYEATKEHPAQVEVYMVDEPEGDWTTTRFSGAIPETRRRELVERIDTLIDAVKRAREEANQHEITDREIGSTVFSYLLG